MPNRPNPEEKIEDPAMFPEKSPDRPFHWLVVRTEGAPLGIAVVPKDEYDNADPD